MKKISFIALITSIISYNSFAQDNTAPKDDFTSHKPEIIANLNKEKAIIDNAISCINSATKREDAEKCREQKKASMDTFRQQMDAAHQQRINQRKEKLQNELNKLNEKSVATSSNKKQ